MVEKSGKRSGFARYSLILIAVLALVFFLLRGPYLSNYIKRILIPGLENVTSERILIEKAVINLFPFYIQTKGFKMFDAEGNRLLWITKARAYIDIASLLSGEVRIRKLTLKEPDMTVKKRDIERILSNLKKSGRPGGNGYRFSVRNIFLTDCNIVYEDNVAGFRIAEQEFDARMTAKGSGAEIDLFMDDIVFNFSRDRKFEGKLKVRASLQGRSGEIETIDFMSGKSSMRLKGKFVLADKEESGSISVEGKVRVTSDIYKGLLGLSTGKSGEINLDGSVNISGLGTGSSPDVKLDLKTDSRFALESLMELLHVDENISGEILLAGRIHGSLQDIAADGTLTLNDGVLGGLPVDNIVGNLEFSHNKFSLSGFTGRVFTGEIKGEGFVSIPYGDYGVVAEVSGVDSPDFFRFIHWEPPIPKGVIAGNFTLVHNHGEPLDLTADVVYRNMAGNGGAVHQRLRDANVSLEMNGGNITFSDVVLKTDDSELRMTGDLDLREKYMALDVEVRSSDVRDLMSPFYENISAPVVFTGSMAGPLGDPLIMGRAVLGKGHIQGNTIDGVMAEFSYKADQLVLSNMKIRHGDASCELKGRIEFRQAKGLFDFSSPYYIGDGSCEDLPVSPLITAFYREMPVSAVASLSFEFRGDRSEYSIPAEVDFREVNAYGYPVDRINGDLEINQKGLIIRNALVSAGGTTASAHGNVFFSGAVKGIADIHALSMKELFEGIGFSADGMADLHIALGGTVRSPVAEFTADISDMVVGERRAGGGSFTGMLRNGKISASGTLADSRIELDLTAELPGMKDWSADIKLRDGRYDFLAAGFFEDIPDDFTLRSEGLVTFRSVKGNLKMRTELQRLNIGMYDYVIKNSGTIMMEMIDNRIYLRSFSFMGNRAELNVSGSFIPGRELDLRLDCDFSVVPLKVLSKEIISLSGRALAGIDIRGLWESPQMFGEITLSGVNATLASRQKIGPVNGTFFLKKERLNFESVTAGYAGGMITLSGEGRFSGISPESLYLNMKLNDVRLRPFEGFKATVNGILFYESSSQGSSLTGSLDLSRGRYEKDVDWKKWLIGMKGVNSKRIGYIKFLSDTELNVRLSGSDDIKISNNLLKAPISLDINIIGKPGSIGIIGRIGADSGTLLFRGNEFRLLEGTSVDFIDPRTIKPLFHIVSESYRDDYHLRLSLDGTVDDFSLSLFSEPPLSEQEILTLLTFGGLGGSSKGFVSGIATEEAASILTGGMQENIQKEIQSITGFERISIEPHTTSTGAFTSRVTVARRLLEDRIKVMYSTTIGSSEEQLVRVEYKLSDEWSIVGSRDELGSVGGDIKFRFEFR
jgi:translocation and assembly module TamB